MIQPENGGGSGSTATDYAPPATQPVAFAPGSAPAYQSPQIYASLPEASTPLVAGSIAVGGGTVAGAGGAREMMMMQPGAVAVAEPFRETGVVDERWNRDEKLRNRVVGLSIAIAVYIVAHAVVDWAFDLAALHELLQKTAEVQHMQGKPPNSLFLMMSGLPNMGMMIIVNLLVPLCGYCGARNRQSCLMCTFSCCNCLTCCCGFVALVMLAGVTTLVGAGAPQLENWMARCDPNVCIPDGRNLTQSAHVVDCLAAGTWTDYKRKFPQEAAYPDKCIKVWLECDGEQVDELESNVQVAQLRGREGPFPAFAVAAPAPAPWKGRRLSAVAPFSRGFPQRRIHWEAKRHKAFVVPDQPADVIKSCQPDLKAMQEFHAFAEIVPDMAPRLAILLMFKAILVIPAIVMGCLGLCWGKEMFNQIQRRSYVVATHPAQMMLQPAFGTVMVSARQADAGVAQPLMLSPPSVHAS